MPLLLSGVKKFGLVLVLPLELLTVAVGKTLTEKLEREELVRTNLN